MYRGCRELKGWRFPAGMRVWVTSDAVLFIRTTRLGWVISGRHLPLLSEGVEDQSKEVWDLLWGVVMKKKDLADTRSRSVHADPTEIKSTYPNLAEFMTCGVYEDISERRQSPTITFWCAGGTWRASVKDRAEGLVLWLSAPSPLELMALLEDFVLSRDAPWRHDDQEHERNGKRAKKST